MGQRIQCQPVVQWSFFDRIRPQLVASSHLMHPCQPDLVSYSPTVRKTWSTLSHRIPGSCSKRLRYVRPLLLRLDPCCCGNHLVRCTNVLRLAAIQCAPPLHLRRLLVAYEKPLACRRWHHFSKPLGLLLVLDAGDALPGSASYQSKVPLCSGINLLPSGLPWRLHLVHTLRWRSQCR